VLLDVVLCVAGGCGTSLFRAATPPLLLLNETGDCWLEEAVVEVVGEEV